MAGKRKTSQDWIDAGLKALCTDGPGGLQAETLARSMGTTKGSFYWHFKDVPSFQRAVLADWETGSIRRFRKHLEAQSGALAQLRAIADLHPTPLDRAIRGWAIYHKPAAAAVKSVDTALYTRISELLAEQGVTHPDFPDLILAAYLTCPPTGRHTETLIDLLLVLK